MVLKFQRFREGKLSSPNHHPPPTHKKRGRLQTEHGGKCQPPYINKIVIIAEMSLLKWTTSVPVLYPVLSLVLFISYFVQISQISESFRCLPFFLAESGSLQSRRFF